MISNAYNNNKYTNNKTRNNNNNEKIYNTNNSLANDTNNDNYEDNDNLFKIYSISPYKRNLNIKKGSNEPEQHKNVDVILLNPLIIV